MEKEVKWIHGLISFYPPHESLEIHKKHSLGMQFVSQQLLSALTHQHRRIGIVSAGKETSIIIKFLKDFISGAVCDDTQICSLG
jgi:hypothetical protein